MTLRRTAAAAASILLAGLLLSACATPSGGTPSGAPTEPVPTDSAPASEVHAAWLDAGRLIGVVTLGSSTCVPTADDVKAEGQTVTVTLVDPEGKPCTRDYVPRATLVEPPSAVDAASDITIVVTGAASGTAVLDGEDDLPGTFGEPTDYEPSAGWYDEQGFVVLTWGSSTCAPAVQGVEASGEHELTLTFADFPADQVCTADMAPRLAVASVPGGFDDEDDVTLILAGAEITGTTRILGDR